MFRFISSSKQVVLPATLRCLLSTANAQSTVRENEIEKFRALSRQWWDVNGPLKALHSFNQLRYLCFQLVILSLTVLY